MTYPPHLRDHEDLLGGLWGSGDLDLVFPELAPKATLPWPRGRRLHRSSLHDRDALATEMAEPLPSIALLDPRTLWASQPYVTRAGVEHYLGDAWFRTGVTYADRHQPFNRLPIVERRADGTDVLLGGHHRSCAALLSGQPVIARCVVHPDRLVGVERVDLRLPCLALGEWTVAAQVATLAEALTAIDAGRRVRAASPTLADQIQHSLRP